jgi:hypothetical protein
VLGPPNRNEMPHPPRRPDPLALDRKCHCTGTHTCATSPTFRRTSSATRKVRQCREGPARLTYTTSHPGASAAGSRDVEESSRGRQAEGGGPTPRRAALDPLVLPAAPWILPLILRGWVGARWLAQEGMNW